MKRIINSSSIWDLHIHSCKSAKSTGEFQKMETKEYVDKILDIFSDYPDLSLISFTDHNAISYEVYKEFYSRNSSINLIPGIEIDVDLKGINDSKHMLFYFNTPINELENFSKLINTQLEGKTSIALVDILDFLISSKKEFLISPHAFKQGKRGLDFDWNDEEVTKNNAHKYIDQFFSFWESSGSSEIAKAESFLKDFELDERISIVSFSDSSDEAKLREYLSNPPQYFKSLPSYKGVQLAGTDYRRILKKKKDFNENESGNYIGMIQIDGKQIELSDRLNAIVGGRGTGKSLLIDNMAINLNKDISESSLLTADRIKFLNSINISMFNFDGSSVSTGSKKIDYFNQAFVTKIFDSSDTGNIIKTYFADEFNTVPELNKDIELNNIKQKYTSCLNNESLAKPNSNISSFIDKYRVIDDKNLGLRLKKGDIHELKKIDFDIEEAINYAKSGKRLIPNELKDNNRINNALIDFLSVIIEEKHKFNINEINRNLESIIREKCISSNEEKSNELKEKNNEEQIFINHFNYECYPFVERASIVNAINRLQKDFFPELVQSVTRKGMENNYFIFQKRIEFEEPLKYFRRMCVNYMGKEFGKFNNSDLFHEFIFNVDESIKSSKDVASFIETLKALKDYKMIYENNILYKTDEKIENLMQMSPGTQTNILMEYIVSKETNIPLLIDQPEDNIDNETIYKDLTEWFNKLKLRRQVIVVTHDANIVINADAENVIIATKNQDGSFDYSYGAMEYDDLLERISYILDGGVEAVERRLKKYGREHNHNNNK